MGQIMQFALVNEERSAPMPKLVGRCVGCGQEMIAKCGTLKIWHWAHKGTRSCDPWWEPETPWHRGWKEHFPAEWREVIQWSESGEKHIADVRNDAGLVVEFQRSSISPEERTSREAFYGNLVWVVDGTRLKNDIPRFERGGADMRSAPLAGYFMTPWPEECFPRHWVDCSKPVFFDFGEHDDVPERRSPRAPRGALWCLLPGRVDGNAVVGRISKTQFIDEAQRLGKPFPTHQILLEIAAQMEAQREAQRQAAIERQRRVRHYQNYRRGRSGPRF